MSPQMTDSFGVHGGHGQAPPPPHAQANVNQFPAAARSKSQLCCFSLLFLKQFLSYISKFEFNIIILLYNYLIELIVLKKHYTFT